MTKEELLAKYAKELEVSYKIYEGTYYESEIKLNTPVTIQENLFMMLDGKKPVWHPKDFDYILFCPRIVPDNIARASAFEAVDTPESEYGGKDMFGIEWEYVPVVGGSMVRPGADAVPDINHWEDYITFPNLDDWDWEASAKANEGFFQPAYPRYGMVLNGMFERLISFMGFENAAMALVDEDQQEGVHRLFDRLCVLYDELLDKFVKYYGINMLCFHDDWGSQKDCFFSLSTCREMVMPYIKRVFESAHKRGIYVDFHCCGKNEKLVPAMIEAGADMWYPQPMNDFDYLYNTYGDKIIFGIPVSAEDDSDETAYRKAVEYMEKYGKNHNTMPYVGRNLNPKFFDYLYCLSREEFAK